MAFNQGQYIEQFERYKVTLNRSGIIEIEQSGEAIKADKSQKTHYSKLKKLLHFKKLHFKKK